MGPGYWGMGSMGVMWIFPIIGIIVMITVIYLILGRLLGRWDFKPPRYDDDQYPHIKNSESALDILKKRYAKGDITKEKFEEMKKNIA